MLSRDFAKFELGRILLSSLRKIDFNLFLPSISLQLKTVLTTYVMLLSYACNIGVA